MLSRGYTYERVNSLKPSEFHKFKIKNSTAKKILCDVISMRDNFQQEMTAHNDLIGVKLWTKFFDHSLLRLFNQLVLTKKFVTINISWVLRVQQLLFINVLWLLLFNSMMYFRRVFNDVFSTCFFFTFPWLEASVNSVEFRTPWKHNDCV